MCYILLHPLAIIYCEVSRHREGPQEEHSSYPGNIWKLTFLLGTILEMNFHRQENMEILNIQLPTYHGQSTYPHVRYPHEK